MPRVVTACVVLLALIAAVFAYPRSGDGCHGHCWGPAGTPIAGTPEASPTPAPSPDARCGVGPGSPDAPAILLGVAVLDQATQRVLCLIDIDLAPNASSNSLVEGGETTAFYVREGRIEFNLDPEHNTGYILVVPANGEDMTGLEPVGDGIYKATTGQSFTLLPGSSIYLDQQPDAVVALTYTNLSDVDDAELQIASAPPPES